MTTIDARTMLRPKGRRKADDGIDLRLAAHRPLRAGAKVIVKRGCRRGQIGIVREQLDIPGRELWPNRSMTGACRYAISMDLDGQTRDYCRFELRPWKRRKRRSAAGN